MSRVTNPGYVWTSVHKFSEREFEAIEQAWGSSSSIRAEIQEAADNYLLSRGAQEKSDEQKAKLSGSKNLLAKLEKSLNRSADILSTLHDDALAGDGVAITAFDALSVREAASEHSLDNDLYRLESFRDQCRAVAIAAEKAKGDLLGASGLHADVAFSNFLRNMGDIYSRATHRRPWANRHRASKSYKGLFINGVAKATIFLGEEHTNIGLGKAIQRALATSTEALMSET